jgi:cell division protein ZapA (FtsZ GTPase activity inhibitor)
MGCTSSSSSDSDDNESNPQLLSGAVAKGYVEGARVFADKLVAGTTEGNQQLDRTNGEVFDISSDTTGDYSLTIPAGYGDFQLFSLGGTIVGDGEPAPIMCAPSDSDNITPVTTLVCLNSELRTKIGETVFDKDIADTDGVDGSVLALAMAVKASLECLEENVPMTDSQALSVVTALADAYNDTTDLKDETQLAEATSTGVKAALEDEDVFDVDEVVFNSDDAAAAIEDAITTIVGSIDMDGTVTESSIKDEVDAAIDDSIPAVADAITKIVKVSISSVTLKDVDSSTIATIQSTDTSKTLTTTQANAVTTAAFTLTGRNDFSTKTYNDAQLIVDVNDTLTLREATATISGVKVTIAATTGNVTLSFGTDVTLNVQGTDINGNTVTATFNNISTQNDANIVTVANNVVTLDLEALDNKLESLTDAEALFDIGRTGNFKLNMQASNVPLTPEIKTITVE